MNVSGECVKTHDPCGTAQEFSLLVSGHGDFVFLSILGLGTKRNGKRMMDKGYVAMCELSHAEARNLVARLSAVIPHAETAAGLHE